MKFRVTVKDNVYHVDAIFPDRHSGYDFMMFKVVKIDFSGTNLFHVYVDNKPNGIIRDNLGNAINAQLENMLSYEESSMKASKIISKEISSTSD